MEICFWLLFGLVAGVLVSVGWPIFVHTLLHPLAGVLALAYGLRMAWLVITDTPPMVREFYRSVKRRREKQDEQ